jgi:hypothetical protein
MNDEWCPPSGEQLIPANLDDMTAATTPDAARDIDASARPAESADLVLGVSEADIRLVDAFYHEVALDASTDKAPPTRAERLANAESIAALARLRAMTPDELRAERARRLRERQPRDGK